MGSEPETVKIRYQKPDIVDYGSIADHTFRGGHSRADFLGVPGTP
jgi:hypothetical protein